MPDHAFDREIVDRAALALTLLAEGRAHAARLVANVRSDALRAELLDRAVADVTEATTAVGPRGAAAWLVDQAAGRPVVDRPPPVADPIGRARALHEQGRAMRAISAELGVHRDTVRRWLQPGPVPAVAPGGGATGFGVYRRGPRRFRPAQRR